MSQDAASKPFHVMAKPVGSTCNLDCAYCFYLSKATLPGGPGVGRMADATLEAYIRQVIAAAPDDQALFSWQGGEPTLLGVDFFRRVVALEHRHARPGQSVQNDLQTNGTRLDEEWCRFLKEHGFLVGLSIDGPRQLHDGYRVTKGGTPTFDQVFAATKLLHRFDVPFNTLTCVSRLNARRPLDVYRFLRREVGSTHMQFIPIVAHRDHATTAPQHWDPEALPRQDDPRARPGHPDSVVTDWSVDPDDWGTFLCKCFDEWLNRDLGKVLVNQFETLVSQHLGLGTQICVYGETCGTALVMEHDGTVYSCDHYVYPEYRVGDIQARPLADIAHSPNQTQFGQAKCATLPGQCRRCPYLTDCWGECPKNRLLRTLDDEPGLNYLCAGFQRFFAHAYPHVERIVADLRQRGGVAAP